MLNGREEESISRKAVPGSSRPLVALRCSIAVQLLSAPFKSFLKEGVEGPRVPRGCKKVSLHIFIFPYTTSEIPRGPDHRVCPILSERSHTGQDHPVQHS